MMDPHLLGQYVDGDLDAEARARIEAQLSGDPELRRELAAQLQADRLLTVLLGEPSGDRRVVDSVCAVLRSRGARELTSSVTSELQSELDALQEFAPVDSATVVRPITWVRWLALAACLTIVAGVWWFHQRQEGAMGLRVAEIQSSEFRVQGSEFRDQRSEVRVPRERDVVPPREPRQSRGNVARTRQRGTHVQRSGGRDIPAVVGMELRQGDRVVVKEGGKVGLKYDGEETRIELMAATEAGFGVEKGAKRVTLDGGTLVCTAAAQKLPFEIKTRHGVARVVGTRFRLAAMDLKTTLAVQEGKVALVQGEKVLEVGAGQEATASDEGMAQVWDQGGHVWAWGSNRCGLFGDGLTNSGGVPERVRLPDGTALPGFTAIAVGVDMVAALGDDRTVWVWSAGGARPLFHSTATNKVTGPRRVEVSDGSPLSDVTAIAVGREAAVAMKADRTVWTWGRSIPGVVSRAAQVKLSDGTPLSDVTALAVGSDFAVAVKSDRTVWTWRYELSDRFGLGKTVDRLVPVQVRMSDGSPLSDVIAVAAGSDFTVALKADTTVWAWGKNTDGQLGDGTMDPECLAPVQVKRSDGTVLNGIIEIAARWTHAVALTREGGVLAWGSNGHGQLGDGTTNRSNVAVQVRMSDGTPLAGVRTIAAGVDHTVALTATGRVWAWGRNTEGQLGDGMVTDRLLPVAVKASDGASLSGITAIAAGQGHTVVLITDNTTRGDDP